jgi:autotransporter-associated beta strand protein/T5SS/PEP-CTERM-associated repeat protein
LTLTGNSLLDATANSGYFVNVIDIGFFPGSVGKVTVGGTSTMRVNNGNVNFPAYPAIAVGDGGAGTLTIQDQALVQTNSFWLGATAQSGSQGGAGTLYLNGGTLSVPAIQNDGGTTGDIYFNGGTLQATASSNNFISTGGTLNAYVQTGGAVIDSNGNDITISQALLHDAGGPALDGGLTKIGSGTLILSGSDNYTGGTDVEDGTLIVTNSDALPVGGSLTVGAGGTFIFDPSLAGGSIEGSSLAVSPAGGVAAVPEPSTSTLLGVAVIGLIAFGCLRRAGGFPRFWASTSV